MEYTGRCVAVSEPNSPNIVAMKCRKFGDSPELRQMARDVIRLECRPYATMQPPPLGYFLKFKAPDAAALPMFRQRLTLYRMSFPACLQDHGLYYRTSCCIQGDHLSGKPGNVRKFDSCQGNVRDFTKGQLNVREKILSGKSCLKLFIVSCIFASVQVFSTSTGVICVKFNMPSAAEECCEPSG